MPGKFFKFLNMVFAPQRAGDYFIVNDPKGIPHAVYSPRHAPRQTCTRVPRRPEKKAKTQKARRRPQRQGAQRVAPKGKR